MNALCEHLKVQHRTLEAMERWFLVFDNVALRRDCPSSYHDELLRQADEMDRLHLIDWTEWRDLRLLADQAFLKAIAGSDYR